MSITEEQLTAIQALNDDVFRSGSECGSTAEQLCQHVDDILAEVRRLRADNAAMRAIVDIADKQWRDESCSNLPNCDSYENVHDTDCDKRVNERALCAAVDAYRAVRK